MEKNAKVFLIILGSIIALLFSIFVLPWLTYYVSFLFLPSPPKPEIRYGEFPFRLVYELNGEQIIVEDTVICEFDGIGVNAGLGKHRMWRGRLASNGKDKVLLAVDGNRTIFFSVGGADFYMGDVEMFKYETEYDYHQFPRAFYSEITDIDGTSFVRTGGVPIDELRDKYGIVLISWEPSEPIINSFR
jgi:hypothetical protein